MNKKSLKKIFFSLTAILLFISISIIFTSCSNNTYDIAADAINDKNSNDLDKNPVLSENGQQILNVVAKSGGYLPKKIEARADTPTVLVVNSQDAYGCERAFNIPDLKISEILPENGKTEFDLGSQPSGTQLIGICSMGMYYFKIIFS